MCLPRIHSLRTTVKGSVWLKDDKPCVCSFVSQQPRSLTLPTGPPFSCLVALFMRVFHDTDLRANTRVDIALSPLHITLVIHDL